MTPFVILEPKVIYEDRDIIVLDKPAGLMVHGVKVGSRHSGLGVRENKNRNGDTRYPMPEPTLVDWLLVRYPEIKTVGDDPIQRPGIVHRLDKDTSGIMVVARNQESFDYLKALFQAHEMKKTYLAVVQGAPKSETGVIDAPIGILTGSTKRSIHSKKMVKEAVTEFKVLGPRHSGLVDREEKSDTQYPTPEESSLLEVKPRTGRTHQIRVHLASIGHPIVGDRLYGGRKPHGYRASGIGYRAGETRNPKPETRLMLHALSLEFADRSGKRLKFEAEPPEGFKG